LGVSWDDIIATLSALRSITGGSPNQAAAGSITILALSLELYPATIPDLIGELGCGLLRLVQRIRPGPLDSVPLHWWEAYFSTSLMGIAGENPIKIRNDRYYWGALIRYSPLSSPKLLSQLQKFDPPWDWLPCDYANGLSECLDPADFYDVVQWLKVRSRSHNV
jgi:hypothetical protein